MDQLFTLFDSFVRTYMSQFTPHSQPYILENWEQFLVLLQTQPLDYGKIYTIINKMNSEDINKRRNLTAASSPRIISSVSKNSTNVLQKFSQMDQVSSPKIAISNLASQQQLIHKTSLQQNIKPQVEDFNRHLLLSKTKELLFNFSVSTDKLNGMARLPLQQNHNSKSPIKYQISYGKTRGSNHSAEHYKQ